MVSTLVIQILTAPKSLTFQWLKAQSRRPERRHNGTISNMQTQDVGPNLNVYFVPCLNAAGPQFFLEQGHPSYEWHRRFGADARDPRCLGGPCQGSLRHLARRGNQHAAYYHCEIGSLRILFIPRIGARGTARIAGPLPADVYGGVPLRAPPMPTPVPGMEQPLPANAKAGPKVGKTASHPHNVHSKQPLQTSNTAAQDPALLMLSATAPPVTSSPQSASAKTGASHATSAMAPNPAALRATPMAPIGSMLAFSSKALPQQEQILGALQSVISGISDLSLRKENSELQTHQTNANTQEIAQRLVHLEGRANQTETALAETAQMAASNLALSQVTSLDTLTIAAEPEGAETWHLPHGDLGSILAESDLTLSNAEQ